MSHRKTGNRYKPTLGGFIQRWYHNHLPLDDFLANVVNDTKRKSVDHANADRHNHCKWNLSDVTASQNSRKNELSFRIKPPYFCYIAVTPDGEYRVACGYTGGIMQCVQTYFLCRDIDSLTDLLKAIVNMKVPPAGIRRSGTPKEILNREPKAFVPVRISQKQQHMQNGYSLWMKTNFPSGFQSNLNNAGIRISFVT